nr:hypothetical protein [uncultured Rhodopila sp.]
MGVDMDIFQQCLSQIGPSADAASKTACFGVQATIMAADINAAATHHAAWFTLIAGICALGGGAFVLLQAKFAAAAMREAEDRSRRSSIRRLAKAYAADINSLHAYLRENDLLGTLRRNAADHSRFYFHPGDHWLRSFEQDPSAIGLFEERLSIDLATYFALMQNELGRLRWMHNLTAPEIGIMGEASLARNQTDTANTIQRLFRLTDDILQRLELAVNPPVWGSGLKV